MEFPCHGENGIEINRSDRPFFLKKKKKNNQFCGIRDQVSFEVISVTDTRPWTSIGRR